MSVTAFDHVAIPTAQPEEMLRFYRALGFAVPSPEEWAARGVPFFSIQFGDNKINVHAPALWGNAAFTLRGAIGAAGLRRLLLRVVGLARRVAPHAARRRRAVEEGPVERVGGRDAGRAKGTSLYTRDPDRNLLEFIVYEPGL